MTFARKILSLKNQRRPTPHKVINCDAGATYKLKLLEKEIYYEIFFYILFKDI